MPKEKAGPKKVRYVISKSRDYRLIAANGVWGGVTPRGDFLLNFIIDSNQHPESIVQEISPEGKLGDQIERHPKEKQDEKLLSRELQIGVVLSPRNAESIANFILNRVKDFAEAKVPEAAKVAKATKESS